MPSGPVSLGAPSEMLLLLLLLPRGAAPARVTLRSFRASLGPSRSSPVLFN